MKQMFNTVQCNIWFLVLSCRISIFLREQILVWCPHSTRGRDGSSRRVCLGQPSLSTGQPIWSDAISSPTDQVWRECREVDICMVCWP